MGFFLPAETPHWLYLTTYGVHYDEQASTCVHGVQELVRMKLDDS